MRDEPDSKRDLCELFAQIQMNDSVRVVVITGSGNAFSAGDDISGHGSAISSKLVPPIASGHHNP